MCRGAGQALWVGVSSTAVSLLRSGGWRGTGATLLAEQAFMPATGSHAAITGATLLAEQVPGERSHEAIGLALRALFAGHEHAGWPVSFVLDDAWTRLWSVTPPPGAARLVDLEAAAALRCQVLYGEAPGAWSMMADWDAAQPFFVAAVPHTLLAVLNESAQEHGLAVVGIAPHFISAWNRWCRGIRKGAWFGLVHEQVLSIGAIGSGRLLAVRVVSLVAMPPDAGHAWLTEVLTREALLLELAPPTLLQLCGQVPVALRQAGANPAHIASLALEVEKNGGFSLAALLAASGSGA